MKAFSLFFLVVGIGYPLVFLDLRRLERKLLKNGIATKAKVISARNYSFGQKILICMFSQNDYPQELTYHYS